MIFSSYAQEEFSFKRSLDIKCGAFFEYIEKNLPNSITLIYKKEKIHISFSWEEWRELYGGQEDKFDELKFKNYIGFYVKVNSDFISFMGKKFYRNELDDCSKLMKAKANDSKICFIVKIDQVMKGKPISDIWDFLYYMHHMSNNRVAYIRFDVPEKSYQEDHSSSLPEETAYQILSNELK